MTKEDKLPLWFAEMTTYFRTIMKQTNLQFNLVFPIANLQY